MLEYYEFAAKEHQNDLLREAEVRALTRRLRAARTPSEEPYKGLDYPRDGSLRATCYPGRNCPDPGGL